MNSIQLTPVEERSPGIAEIPPVILPSSDSPYTARAARLRHLAVDHAMADYLQFIAHVVESQQYLHEASPLPDEFIARLSDNVGTGSAPLSNAIFVEDRYWQHLLGQMIEKLYADASVSIRCTLDQLRDYDEAKLESIARSLLAGTFGEIDSGQALFIWAALSVYFRQLASKLPAVGKVSLGEERQHCPVCASTPVGSVIMIGAQSGLRYLQCGLCESRWHMVRIKCTNCEGTGRIDYWSVAETKVAIKAESCGDCSTYLKVVYPEYDQEVELLADDIASLAMDAEMEREGFSRSGISPFFFPGNA
ncbi:formate dehydrogenase accessory protein FdhE [Pseudomonas sp. PA-3-11C]|uniref:formate dehydrogenase accessory protein FdhE n=1 Tax=unclassified Pseudomonas TaxID=196821 RepID=UPI001F23FF62|nr:MULTISPECIES: formate dehydrogenase accessory protein FdhE [unclassified Pseudomonas]MCF5510845.1 formate dehydrogenase accessory protein FdhE [Pseudomonas sp. PA-3-6H]MCF5517835.1 formate dehydrogenase accessory protein FdhE [Pseudomonas sp. PA-3-6E]MCF5564898.1 formate dehydrogenase accessory protein FdhE [Pseudomonas sp. PA-3-5D]MCF5570106.1 formate dehydrogenase accessory protein FdhE [Pseudomonas sp. PA-3-11C]MCF5596539.1 formate dehydrogenase accessory protein FdhE [Pseudomonas sp. PA